MHCLYLYIIIMYDWRSRKVEKVVIRIVIGISKKKKKNSYTDADFKLYSMYTYNTRMNDQFIINYGKILTFLKRTVLVWTLITYYIIIFIPIYSDKNINTLKI